MARASRFTTCIAMEHTKSAAMLFGLPYSAQNKVEVGGRHDACTVLIKGFWITPKVLCHKELNPKSLTFAKEGERFRHLFCIKTAQPPSRGYIGLPPARFFDLPDRYFRQPASCQCVVASEPSGVSPDTKSTRSHLRG